MCKISHVPAKNAVVVDLELKDLDASASWTRWALTEVAHHQPCDLVFRLAYELTPELIGKVFTFLKRVCDLDIQVILEATEQGKDALLRFGVDKMPGQMRLKIQSASG